MKRSANIILKMHVILIQLYFKNIKSKTFWECLIPLLYVYGQEGHLKFSQTCNFKYFIRYVTTKT